MFPPEPTTNPQQLLGNVWASLSRAAGEHWGQQATVLPSDDGQGYKATLRTDSVIPNEVWIHATKYIRAYGKASHWSITELTRKRGYIEMHLSYVPPKPRQEQRPAHQKIS